MTVKSIIPARLKSTRFPAKPLALICGKPMILHVAEISATALGNENTYIATDSQEIFDVVVNAGFQAVMTSEEHRTGTDRLAEAISNIEGDVFINIQGDEPMLDPDSIRTVVEWSRKYPDSVINGYASVGEDEDVESRNLPKCVVSSDGRLLYMSRSVVPGSKSYPQGGPPKYLKQVCVYAFKREHLESFALAKEKSEFEESEDIEILRFLDLNIEVRMVQLPGSTIAVDSPEDLQRVDALMRNG